MIFIIIAVALAGVPVWRLTRPADAVASVTPAVAITDPPAGKTLPLEVEAVFAPAPTSFQIKNLDQTVLAGRGPESRFTTRWTGSVPPEGVDLVVQAHWPASTGPAAASAARVTVRFPDGHAVEKSFWAAANGTLADVLTLPGTTPPGDTP